MRRSSWSPCPRAARRATASTCAWSSVRARRVRVACTGLAAVAPAALSDARACRVCVAGKTVTVVVPDELQPGQVLAVRPRPALLPLASAPHPPAAAVMGGPPCSHPHPCPAYCPAAAAQAQGETTLTMLAMLTVLTVLRSLRRPSARRGRATSLGSFSGGKIGGSGSSRAAAGRTSTSRGGEAPGADTNVWMGVSPLVSPPETVGLLNWTGVAEAPRCVGVASRCVTVRR